MIEEKRQQRFRFRLRTLLFVVAIVALLLVVVIQQVQMARMRRQIGQMQKSLDAEMKVKDTMAAILREFRDKVERQK